MHSIFENRTELGKTLKSGRPQAAIARYTMTLPSCRPIFVQHWNVDFDDLSSEAVFFPGA